jgi:ParB family chromosome partitioning protein
MAEEKKERLEFAYIPLELIDVSPSNVRRSNLEEGIDELKNSIREIGIQQPVMVFKKGERYELLIGQRRFLACKKAHETEIPAVITKVKNKTEAIIRSLSENIHRRDLDYRDKMQAALELRDQLKYISKVAKWLGVTTQTIKNYLGYAAVPEKIKLMVADKKLSASLALRITRGIPDEKLAIGVAEKIKDITRSEQKNLFVDVAIENPHENIKKIEKTTQKISQMKKITLYVTKRVYDAICKAAERYESDRQMIVKSAVEEWLTERNFIK